MNAVLHGHERRSTDRRKLGRCHALDIGCADYGLPVRLAVLDVGSNTVNLLVMDAARGAAPVPVHTERMDLRLAEHITADGRIRSAAVTKLVGVVKQAAYRARKLECEDLFAFATSAIREAANGPDVIRTVREQTGLKLAVMPGQEEAELTFLAVRRWYGWSSGRLLVVDIGGGSVELAVGDDETPQYAISLPLGAGRMYREHFHNDPPRASEVRALREHIADSVSNHIADFADGDEIGHCVATSKTFRQLARLCAREARGRDDGPPLLRRGDLDELTSQLVRFDIGERAALPRISEARAPQLAAGAVVAHELMVQLGIDVIEVCPWALREGVILRRIG